MAKINPLGWYNNLSAREKKIFHTAAGFITILLLDFTVATPVWDAYVQLTGQITEAEANLMRNTVNLKRKEAVESEYEKFRSFVKQAGPDEEENARLLSELEQLARANQVVLVDMKPRETKTMTFHKEYAAELDAESEIKNLLGFIYQVETSSQLMKVAVAKLSPREPQSTVVKARLTITKTAFLGGT